MYQYTEVELDENMDTEERNSGGKRKIFHVEEEKVEVLCLL